MTILEKLIGKIFESLAVFTRNSVGLIDSPDATKPRTIGEQTTNIQHKILQFRKEKMLAGKSGDGLVYRVSKDEAIEVAEVLSKLDCNIMNLITDPDFCIEMAKDGIFKPLNDLILHMGTLFGVEIHPDWQEYTNKNMYY